jgi:putative glutathione S-transferase
MLNSEFNEVAKNPDVDLYPTDLTTCIDELNEWIYPDINDGVYKSGFAKSQEAYEEAVETLFAALDRAEDLLSRKRYLTGDRLTEADIRLFVTLVRFDEVYTVHFKCNKKHIREYPALLGYMREIYQLPGIKETVNMWHIKNHYYGSHPSINPHGVVPVGGGTDLTVPHGRDSL